MMVGALTTPRDSCPLIDATILRANMNRSSTLDKLKLNNRPIGVFDSGVGGLTVLRALAARLPGESFVYLGDTARLPYGTKSRESIERYALQAAALLVRRKIKFLVVAC